ncbi:MAG: SpoIID/LytB domain-containing protein, partial [Acidobacteriia bacterium]|nr:SpoIID/LytB domain-containing protein [Terriglobia bacterium]
QRPSPTPTPTAPPPELPTTLTAVPASTIPERPDSRPPVVRVLLQAPPEPALPEPGRRYVCSAGEGPVVLRGPLKATALQGRAAIQVGAFTQEANARALLVRLVATGFEGKVTDQGGELLRVVALVKMGETDEALAERLRQAGFNEQRKSAAGALGVVVQGEGESAVQGPRVRVVPLDPDPVRVGTKAVRGELELRPAATGVAVINVVNLEEYLRGVVPAEMGPRAFPLLEAQKAQAVAARTYAVAHLGEHAADGYDLCDSQLCQVYGGADAESPLSDRAVVETSGEIVTWQGRPIDAMYHSTCAGHTEDGAAVFPQRAQPYLKGVECRGERALAVGVSTSAGPWLGEVERLAAVGGRLAGSLGVPAQPRALTARLAGVQPGAGIAGLERAFGLDRTAAAIHVARGKTSEESALDLLRQFRLPLPPPPRGNGRANWEMAIAVRLGQLAGAIQAVGGRVVPGPSGARLVTDGPEVPRDLTGHETLLERRGERWRLHSLEFPAGSAATLWCAGEACPLVEVEPLDDADAGSAWTWWVREFSLEDLARKLSVAGAREITVARRGVSGRALTVVVASNEGKREIGGLAFRRALDLPDTLFDVVQLRNGKTPAVRFLGRGWGHGVGMCQNGAYGLARGGMTYAEILKKYYTGVELAHWGGETHEQDSRAGPRDP